MNLSKISTVTPSFIHGHFIEETLNTSFHQLREYQVNKKAIVARCKELMSKPLFK